MNPTIRTIIVLSAALTYLHPALAQTQFTEVGRQAGVADSIAANAYMAWGDYDNDGYLDLYVTNWGYWVKGLVTAEGITVSDSLIAISNRFYRNNWDGTFTDMTAPVGMIDPEILTGPIAWGDYDNDGDLDLYVSNTSLDPQKYLNTSSRLYQNNGDGTFTEVAVPAGVTNDKAGGSGCVWGDFDNDGWLDLFVTNTPLFDAEGKADLLKSIPGRLYRNNQDGTFTDVATRAGVDGYGYYVASGDYDDDGALDLYVTSDYNQLNPSRLYRNNGDGTFTDVAIPAGVSDLREIQSLSAAWADYDNDGDLDLYRVNNNSANTLYRNNRDGTFTDVAASAGVMDEKIGFGMGAAWADYDNDGFLDLYVTNLAASSPTRLFHNNGDGTFTDVGTEAGANSPDGLGAVWGDYDNDGFLDLFVAITHVVDGLLVGAPNLLFHNEGNSSHWLILQLKGTISNRDAIGAKVIAVAGKTRQRRDVESAGPGWASQPSLPVEFGFGSAAMVDSLIIRWPSGIVQVMTQVATDQYLVLEESREHEPTAVLEEHTAALPTALSLSQNYPNPFNSSTVIRFSLPISTEVELGVYDLAGQRVALLVRGMREAGSYAVTWDGRDEAGKALASGTYVCRLQIGDKEETRKLALVR